MGGKGASGFDPQRLIDLRTAAGLSVRGLARLAGISPSDISRYEDGQSAPQADRLAAIASALGAKPGDLIASRGDLASLRAAAGLLQHEVVDKAGPDWSLGRYRPLELGRVARLRHDDTETLASIFGVTPEQVRAAHRQSIANAQSAHS